MQSLPFPAAVGGLAPGADLHVVLPFPPLLFAIFYALTVLATVAYYRRRIISGLADAVVLGVLPLGAVGFLGWVLARTLSTAPAVQVWSLAGITGAGVVMMLAARIFLRPGFFSLPGEATRAGTEPLSASAHGRRHSAEGGPMLRCMAAPWQASATGVRSGTLS